MEHVDDLVQVVTEQGEVIYSSFIPESFAPPAEVPLQFLLSQWVHPDDADRVHQEFDQFKKSGSENCKIFYRLVTRTTQVFQVKTNIINELHNSDIGAYIFITTNITLQSNAEESIKRQHDLYQLMTDISKRFLNADLQSAVAEMLQKIGKFACVDRAYVYVLDEPNQYYNCLYEWRNPAAEKFPSLYYQNGFPVEQSPWMHRVLSAAQILNFEDIQTMPPEAARDKAMYEADSTLSVLLIPMLVNKKLIGFIGYDSVLQRKKWLEDDIKALEICTEILTSALLRADAQKAIQQSLSVNKAIIESTAEGILVTDLNDNIITYNNTFKEMWLLPDEALPLEKASIAFRYALENVENAEEMRSKVREAIIDQEQPILVTAFIKNKRVIECISKPQIIEGEVVGRVWSNRDITNRIMAEREEREKGVAQAQFESLKNQVNPHFLFNSLNVLSSLVHIDADLSEQFIDQLARSYRYLLEQKDKELVPLKTEIDFINAFTFLLKIRFEEKLKVNIHLDANSRQYYIAPLTLQLLIENAVKHNIISAETPLVIDIFSENDMYLVVKNNLQLRESQLPSTGVGQKNIKSRYKLFTSTEVIFSEEDNCYIAKIPFIKNA